MLSPLALLQTNLKVPKIPEPLSYQIHFTINYILKNSSKIPLCTHNDQCLFSLCVLYQLFIQNSNV